MFRNVLVPLDGSAAAEHALPWAVAAAAPSGTVHLVHIHLPPVPVVVEGVVMSDPSLDESAREQEGESIVRLAERVRAAAPRLAVVARTIDTDDGLADALAKAAADAAADLVAMTTHGRGPFARFWLGSVADEFLRHSPAPVLVLRPRDPDAPPDLAAKPALRQLIIPLDGSDLAGRILEPAARLGGVFGAEYTLLTVLDPADDPVVAARRAEAYLEPVARSIAERAGAVRTRVVRKESPAEAVLALAGGDPATGVALATHGRSGVGRLLHGSVADELVRKAPGPVLVLHPPG